MRDEGLVPDKKLTRSQRAVKYVLERIQRDPNLRHYMLGTEAFNLLCAAEAKRLGKTKDTVQECYSEMAPHCRGDRPTVTQLREQLERIEDSHEEKSARNKTTACVQETADEIKTSERLLAVIEDLYGRKGREEIELHCKLLQA